MAEVKFGSAGVSAKEIDLTGGPLTVEPTGIPAGVIGTSAKGRAFVPTTVGRVEDFESRFGKSDGKKFAPLAAREWLRNAGSLTFVRVLGIGKGKKRETDGSVDSAGFVVGEEQPHITTGKIEYNPYANRNGILGRTHFLGCFMSESAGSTIFSSAGIQGSGGITPGVDTAVPIVRGVLMAPSGVVPKLSASYGGTNTAPASTLEATAQNGSGQALGSVILTESGVSKQEFVLLLNGHKGTDAAYPNVITASFDRTAVNYFGYVLNTDPYKFQEAGHYLYARWDIMPTVAVVTGTGLLGTTLGAGGSAAARVGAEASVFILTGSAARNAGSSTVPNYETFETRFEHAKTPWITSQKFGGVPQNLFRLHALDAGAANAHKLKVCIENIAKSDDDNDRYGTFDIIVRDITDRDTEPRVLESFRGLSLNPTADRYISKIIGDLNVYFDFDRLEPAQKVVVDGNYENNSNYFRVEVADEVENAEIDSTALPVGVRGYFHLVTSGTAPLSSGTSDQLNGSTSFDALKRAIVPPVQFRKSISVGTGNTLAVKNDFYWGVQTEHIVNVNEQNLSVFRDESVPLGHTKYFNDFADTTQVAWAGANEGAADSATLAILDADRFNRNVFSLENIRVVTASNGLANSREWKNAVYVRDGNVGTSDTDKTRAWSVDDTTQSNRKFAKFSLFMQGGFDGVNLFSREEAEMTDSSIVHEMVSTNGRGTNNGPTVKAYTKALQVMKNLTDVDIQLLAIPGIRNSVVTDAAISAVEERFDAMYIMDVEEKDVFSSVVTGSSQKVSVSNTAAMLADRSLNTSFAAAYFPDVVMQDPNTKTNVRVPPSVAVLGAFALNDRLAHPWFAPAGFVRGALPTVLEAALKLSKSNMDTLYDVDINPLVAFPGNAIINTQSTGGVTVWGQKTLYAVQSSLDRVNVRRLMIDLRRQVREISKTFIFEPNRESTLAAFKALVDPRFERVKKLSGVERYLVKIDLSTTSQADIDNNTIRGKIFVQPTRTIEFVELEFVVTN